MAIAFAGAASEAQLVITYEDFFGQKTTKRIPIGPAVTDADILAIVTDFDNASNAQLFKVTVESVRAITGMKGAAVNALERKVSDVLELTFVGVNSSNGKPVERSIGIPAPIAATFDTSGIPVAAQTQIADLITKLTADLAYINGANAVVVGGLSYNSGESHLISMASAVE